MKLLLDTCSFLWLTSNQSALSESAARLLSDTANEAYLSAASTWELAIKYHSKRLEIRMPVSEFVPHHRQAHGILSLPIDDEAALYAAQLPKFHNDPFDRMLIAQAILHGMALLTPDPLIRRYPVRTIW